MGRVLRKCPSLKKPHSERVCWVTLPATTALDSCHGASSFYMSHLKQTNKQQTWTKAAPDSTWVCVLARAARSCEGETRSFLGVLRGLLLTLVSTFYSPLVYSLFSCVRFFFRKHIITASKSTYLGKMVISVV